MFIKRKDYYSICDIAEERREKLEELQKQYKELSDNRYSIIAENIIYKKFNEEVLDIIESNSYGRTDKQKLQKIKELADANLTNSTILKHIKR